MDRVVGKKPETALIVKHKHVLPVRGYGGRSEKSKKEKSNFTDPQLRAGNAVAQTKLIKPDSKELSFKIFPILLHLFSRASVFSFIYFVKYIHIHTK